MSDDAQKDGPDWRLEGQFSIKDLLAALKEAGEKCNVVVIINNVSQKGSNNQAHVDVKPHQENTDVQQIISRADGDALVKCFEELKSLAADVKQTQAALDEAIREAESARPKGPAIATAWQKAKAWIDTALKTSFWVGEKAKDVGVLVEKIRELLGSPT